MSWTAGGTEITQSNNPIVACSLGDLSLKSNAGVMGHSPILPPFKTQADGDPKRVWASTIAEKLPPSRPELYCGDERREAHFGAFL